MLVLTLLALERGDDGALTTPAFSCCCFFFPMFGEVFADLEVEGEDDGLSSLLLRAGEDDDDEGDE